MERKSLLVFRPSEQEEGMGVESDSDACRAMMVVESMRIAITNIGRLVVSADPGSVEAVDGAYLLVEDGRVADFGRGSAAPACSEVVDAQGRLVTPGLIDAHSHLVFAGSRADEFEMRSQGASYEEIAAAGGGIRSTVAKTRAASDDQLFLAGKKHAQWMIANGTTRLEAKSGYGLSLEHELRLLRVSKRIGDELRFPIHLTLLAAHAIPEEFEGRKDDYVALVLDEIMPAARGLATAIDLFVEANYFDHEDARRLADRAHQLGLGLRLHVDQLSNGGGAALAAELGAKTADHLEHTDAAGIAAMKAAGTIPVLLPASVFALGKRKYPDARAMLDAGLPVVLATDFNPGSSPTPSLPFVMALACTQMGMTPAEALSACTLHAARSLDCEEEMGSLEIGKLADFVVWNCEHEREIPYWIGAPIVHETWIGGTLGYRSPKPSSSGD